MGKRFCVFLIRCYQVGFRWMPPTCRFTPSCSEYTRLAILEHGAIAGIWLGAKRIARCGPWHSGGHDPVPSKIVNNPENPLP